MAQRKAHIIDDRERTVDIQTEENVDFRSMYLSEHVLNGLKATGFERPSPIQLAAIPLGRCGLDMVVQAKSGTGKTCVFAVVALEMISVSASTTQVLILTPTREIAVQVTQVISAIGCKIQGLRVSTFIGGLHLSLDKAKLKCCHIAVGTPGRITQLIEMRLLRLDNVRLFVLDEADQLLTGQFADGIAQIASGLPLNKQVLALSATYTEDVAKVAEGLMRTPNHVRLGKESPALIGIGQFVKLLPYHHQPHRRQQIKLEELMNILCTVTFNQCLVFSNSQLRAESVCNQLRSAGWPAAFLTGGQAQQDRLVALDALCSYKCRVLVSTDLSARGLDSEHVNLVINLDLPKNHATYLHRIGRAGRFGSRGNAVTLVTEGEEWQVVRAIATLANVQIALLHGDLTADITSKEEENHEFVEFLSGDEFEDYLNVADTQENNLCKKGKSKNVKSNIPNGNKQSGNSCTSEEYVESFAHGKNKQGKGNKKDHLNVKKSSRQSLQKERKLESDKKAEEKEEAQRKSLASVISILKRVNLEHAFLPVSFSEIMTDIASKYDSISADDNPLVNVPSLPDAVEMSEKDKKDLLSHWKCLEDSLQKVILNSNDSWKDFMFSVENGLHSRINGETNPIEGIDIGESVNIKLQNGSEAASSSGSDKYSSSEENQFVPSKHQFKESLGSQKKSSVIKQGTQAEMKAHKKTSRVNKNESVGSNYPYYPGYDPFSYGAYADEEDIESYSSSDSQVDNNWFSVGDMKNVSDPIYANASFENYMRYNFIMYQKYLDNVEKFSAMMDYVQTMGKISALVGDGLCCALCSIPFFFFIFCVWSCGNRGESNDMKTLGLLIALASLACCAASQSCFSRQEKKDLAKMRMANRCKDPTERFVHVPVPDGFEYIMPSTVQVKRCDGYCWMMNRACLPTKIEKKMVKVQATRMAPNMVTAMECPVVEVDEHVSCGCECMTSKEDCSENQEFDDKSCSCMCKEDLREMCGGDKMWSSERCLCISNGVLQEMAGDLDD